MSCEVLTRQKKRFQFKRWHSEIGGDLSIVHSLTLRGRHYTVFLNADAMGKSMQGAGGSIVCGTLFKTIVARTQNSYVASAQFPEQWLNACYEELQNVFVSFEGTMMVSAVIGLLEDETGLVYYINAEHPAVVLLRAGHAQFLENNSEAFLRKIGIDGTQEDLVVRTARLLPGDVLILGSDGRDDIALMHPEKKSRQINEDETIFLRIVETASGHLDRVATLLEESGSSLTTFRWFASPSVKMRRISAEDREGPESLRKDGIELLRSGNYLDAVEVLQAYIGQIPEDTEALYLVSFALKKLADRKKMRLAVAYGECCRLRSPKMIQNLNNLADCYRLLGNEERAQELLRRAQELAPENERTRVAGEDRSRCLTGAPL
ncbi:MAG: SpoIIE family protein phosphatase [Mesorhizobium sp.]